MSDVQFINVNVAVYEKAMADFYTDEDEFGLPVKSSTDDDATTQLTSLYFRVRTVDVNGTLIKDVIGKFFLAPAIDFMWSDRDGLVAQYGSAIFICAALFPSIRMPYSRVANDVCHL